MLLSKNVNRKKLLMFKSCGCLHTEVAREKIRQRCNERHGLT